MSIDLNIKAARLISDFRAVSALVEFIEHELEKRVIARLGLIKIEALASIAATYKNQIRNNLGPGRRQTVTRIEALLAQMRCDLETGIRAMRNVMGGHLLQLNTNEVQDHWLFMGHSTFTILSQDLDNIDAEFRALDPAYPGATTPPALDPELLTFWRSPEHLGPPDGVRVVNMQTGLWTPDVVAPVVRGQGFQGASVRVFGLRLSIRQEGLILLPFWLRGGAISTYERLLIELSVVDFFSLEEAIFDGNQRGATPSLVDEWASIAPPHQAARYLVQLRGRLSASRADWRDNVRDKICAHMDLEIPAADLEVERWPMAIPDFNAEMNRLCGLLAEAARLDSRTLAFIGPALPVGRLGTPQGQDILRWANT